MDVGGWSREKYPVFCRKAVSLANSRPTVNYIPESSPVV
jgi:hypothetical protein